MTDAKSYIDNDGEVREIDEAFFANAKTGRPPKFASRRGPESIGNSPERILEIRVQIENDPDTWEPLENSVPNRV